MRTEVNGLRLQIQKYGEVDGTQGFRKAITSTMALEKKKKKAVTLSVKKICGHMEKSWVQRKETGWKIFLDVS